MTVDRQPDKQTNMLIAILRSHIRHAVTTNRLLITASERTENAEEHTGKPASVAQWANDLGAAVQ